MRNANHDNHLNNNGLANSSQSEQSHSAVIQSHQVSLYPSVTCPRGGKAVSLVRVIGAIREGKWRSAVDLARGEYRQHGKSPLYIRLKGKLPCFTPGGVFSHRSIGGLDQASGIVQGDIDGLTDRRLDWALDDLRNDPHTAYVFLSPSGSGLKYGFRIPIVENDDEYRTYFFGALHYARRQFGFKPDPQNEAISQPCYVSLDADVYYNPNAALFTQTCEKPQKTPPTVSRIIVDPAQPLPEPLPYVANESSLNRIHWAIQTIAAAAPHQRHGPRLRVGRLLGGWIQGGILPCDCIETVVDTARKFSDEPDQAEHDIRQAVEHGRYAPISRLGEYLHDSMKHYQPKTLSKVLSRHSLARKVTR